MLNPIEIIESNKNNIVKKIISLKTKKQREKDCFFVVEGIRFVLEIPFDWKINFYAISETFLKENDMSLFEKRAKVFVFKNSLFASLSDTQNAQGILAVCNQKSQERLDIFNKKEGFYILLDELSDPGNLGTIIRTADACGALGIFISDNSVDLYNPKVLRATMGSIFHIPIFVNTDLKECIKNLKEKDTLILAAHLKGTKYHYDVNMKNKCAIIIGNEAFGISKEISSLCDIFVKIPIIGLAESLNASVAAGVLMYEAVRQKMMEVTLTGH